MMVPLRLARKRIKHPRPVRAMDDAALDAEKRQFLLPGEDTFNHASYFVRRLRREGRMPEQLHVMMLQEVEQIVASLARPLRTRMAMDSPLHAPDSIHSSVVIMPPLTVCS